ncbi:hypothetical protein D3C72_2184500 [compost metagenome]
MALIGPDELPIGRNGEPLLVAGIDNLKQQLMRKGNIGSCYQLVDIGPPFRVEFDTDRIRFVTKDIA